MAKDLNWFIDEIKEYGATRGSHIATINVLNLIRQTKEYKHMNIKDYSNQEIKGAQFRELVQSLPISEPVDEKVEQDPHKNYMNVEELFEWNEQSLTEFPLSTKTVFISTDEESPFDVSALEAYRVDDEYTIGIQLFDDHEETQVIALIVFGEEPSLKATDQDMLLFWYQSPDHLEDWLAKNKIVKV